MQKNLYKWQEECLKCWFKNKGRGIVQAVTGSGKTLLALTAARQMAQERGKKLHVKIVVPTNALMKQWERDLKEFLSDSSQPEYSSISLRDKIGLRGGGHKASPDCPYMIYVINSARYELARQILEELKRGEDVLLIADECHHYESSQNRLIFEFLPYIQPYEGHFFSLGLSATLPGGQALHYLTSVLGNKIYHYGMTEASAGQTICQYDIYHIGISFRDEEQAAYDELTERISIQYQKLLHAFPSLNQMGIKDRYEFLRNVSRQKNRKLAAFASLYMNLSYKRKSLVCLASARIDCACDLIRRLDHKDKIIIFSERIEQAENLYQLLQKYNPGKAARYHSKMGTLANKNALERFRTGSIRILIACKAIDEGIDVPDASIGIILSGTSSQRQRIQRLGRIVRKCENKKGASLYYLHIEKTSEDSCYLPDVPIHNLFHLEYDSILQKFHHPDYDKEADKLLDALRSAGSGEEQIQEAKRCLEIGCVRSDWILSPDDITEHIRQAKYTSDKNYWICMKGMQSDKERRHNERKRYHT